MKIKEGDSVCVVSCGWVKVYDLYPINDAKSYECSFLYKWRILDRRKTASFDVL